MNLVVPLLRFLMVASLFQGLPLLAQHRQAPPGMFKELDDQVLGDGLIVHGKQLFIDDYLVEKMVGVTKTLHQPVKYVDNPLLVKDQPWEESGPGYTTVIYDPDEEIFKMWYGFWNEGAKPSEQTVCYATSSDGILWKKPLINEEAGSNVVTTPDVTGFQCAGVFMDPVATDSGRRYKMLFSAAPDGTAKTWSTGAAYSSDGITWTAEEMNPLIPFSDTQICPFWDARRGRYVAHLRFGPPNDRIASRIESEDFLHWSPKVTLFSYRRSRLDAPFQTKHYMMAVAPYEGVYVGMLFAYHGETIQPIPADQLWRDKSNTQLTFSRNGATWMRVGRQGAIPPQELLADDRDWKAEALGATWIPYGEHGKDWDWGAAFPVYQPSLAVREDKIFLYYVGQNTRHWDSYHGDTDKKSGIGLATLRLDGFVSVGGTGILTTKPFVFFGDTLVANADATEGSITAEALDSAGTVIPGFDRDACVPITSDNTRHLLTWRGKDDLHLLQARPIKLRFHIENARLYAFEPRIRHNHYLQSYD